MPSPQCPLGGGAPSSSTPLRAFTPSSKGPFALPIVVPGFRSCCCHREHTARESRKGESGVRQAAGGGGPIEGHRTSNRRSQGDGVAVQRRDLAAACSGEGSHAPG